MISAALSCKQLVARQSFSALTEHYGKLRHNISDSREQRELARQGQITERLGRAIGHLGSENTTIRLGGIYEIDRIARESEWDRRAIVNVLAAYVREHSPWPPGETAIYSADRRISDVPPLRVRVVDVQRH
jgi:hypothetical protein